MRYYKLGKLAPKYHPKTLCFSAFLKADALPPPPEKRYWEYKIPPASIGMFGNDAIRDCTCAEVAHHLMLITAHTGTMVRPTDAEVIAMYSAITGYDPSQTDSQGNNPSDTGAAITDVLNYWQTTGLAGHKIEGWASVDPTNIEHCNQAINLFLGLSTGVQLPAAAEQQFEANVPWTPLSGDPIEGGHNILESGYGADGRNFESWGKGDVKADNAWNEQYPDEKYIVLTKDLISAANGLSPTAMNWDALVAALAALKS